MLELFGDKAAARALAARLGVPVLRGTDGGVSVDEAAAFLATLPAGAAMILKAVAGGGGRGARIVHHRDELADAYAPLPVGGDVGLRQRLALRRGVAAAGPPHRGADRRRRPRREPPLGAGVQHPAPPPEADRDGAQPHARRRVRDRIIDDALRIAARGGLREPRHVRVPRRRRRPGDDARYVFLEANPRLQVEHTVTEEVLGLDLVRAQLELAAGATLGELGLDQASVPAPRGIAVQARVNMETMSPDGVTRPASGVLTAFEVPSGAGYRTDSFGYVGYRTSTSFDSLLAKVIVHTPSGRLADAARQGQPRPGRVPHRGRGHQRRVPAEHPRASRGGGGGGHDPLRRRPPARAGGAGEPGRNGSTSPPATRRTATGPRLAGVKLASADPLAVLDYGKSAVAARPPRAAATAAASRRRRRPGRHHARGARRSRAPSCRSPWPRATPCAPASSCSSWKR